MKEESQKRRLRYLKLTCEGRPEAAQGAGQRLNLSGAEAQPAPRQPDLIEKMLERDNLLKALQAWSATEVPPEWMARKWRSYGPTCGALEHDREQILKGV